MKEDPPRSFWLRLRALLRRRKLDRDLDEELAFHLAMREQKLRDSGLSAAEAHHAARRRFGNMTLTKEDTRDLWLFRWLESLWFDVRYAARSMRRSPVLALVIMLSLALGIGANTAIFAVVDSVMLKLLPVYKPKELMLLTWSVPGKFPHNFIDSIEGDGWSNEGANFGSTTFSRAFYDQLQQQDIFTDAIAYSRNRDRVNVGLGANAESVWLQAVSGNFLQGLGVPAIVGRPIVPSDDADGQPLVVMASYKFWQEKLGGEQSAVGRTLVINGQPATLIGVLPAEFFGTIPGQAPELWSTLTFHRAEYKRIYKVELVDPKIWWLGIIGRLKPGAAAGQAQTQAGLIFQHSFLPAEQAADAGIPRLTLQPAERGLNGLREEFSTSLLLLMGMVGLVLLIACTNVAGLLLARATARRREIATRLSLGAARGRIIRQLLAESALLASIGGAAGLLLARWATPGLAALLSTPYDTIIVGKQPDWRMISFTAAVSLLCGFAFGLAPAFRATRVAVFETLKQTSATIGGRRRFVSGKVLAGAQVALSLLLVIAAGLLLGTLRRLQSVDLGFRRDGLIFFQVEPGSNGYQEAELIRYYEDLQHRLKMIPGVTAVGMSQLPVIGEGWSQGRAYFPDAADPEKSGPMYRHWVTPEYFSALGLPVLAGRVVEARDSHSAPLVAVLNRRAVELYLPKAANGALINAVGRTMKMGNAKEYTIIGVVGSAKFGGVREDAPPTAYFSYVQRDAPESMTVHVRFSGEAGPVIAGVQRQVLAEDRNVPIHELSTMSAAVDHALAVERTFAFLSSAFGGLALLLACIGLYGTISYAVAQRTSEIGIRMALGAHRGSIAGMVVRETLLVIVCGVAVGLPLAWAGTRLLREQLFGLSPHDPLTIAVALAIISAVTLLAGLLPARRAAAVDPMVALRCE